MTTLLEEYYRNDLHNPGYIERKTTLTDESAQIIGISHSGKTSLIKHYLLDQKKSSYLYLNCADIRIDISEINATLKPFCYEHKISILALDNYRNEINLFPMSQILISGEISFNLELPIIRLNLLDFEEFLAFEQRFDDIALNHFFQLGGFPGIHKVPSEERAFYIQKILLTGLEETEFSIMKQATKMLTQKVSAFNLYERLKTERKISKDKLYAYLELLYQKNYLHKLHKFNHPHAITKLYLSDITIKHALNLQKHFGKLFENLIYLELFKHSTECYYDEGIDFYLPIKNQIILSTPFANEHALFKKVESLEGFIITHNIKEVLAITMNLESSLSHPIANIEMIPFTQWTLSN